jgi:hypothetical protein
VLAKANIPIKFHVFLTGLFGFMDVNERAVATWKRIFLAMNLGKNREYVRKSLPTILTTHLKFTKECVYSIFDSIQSELFAR